jgi:hypothetical protein
MSTNQSIPTTPHKSSISPYAHAVAHRVGQVFGRHLHARVLFVERQFRERREVAGGAAEGGGFRLTVDVE